MAIFFPVHFSDGRTALAVRLDQAGEVSNALGLLGLQPPRRVVVVVGGAGGLDPTDFERLRPLFEFGLVPVTEDLGAVAIDGGTRSGVMRLLGEARVQTNAEFPLVGVAAAGTVALPGDRGTPQGASRLERNHTHFLLVPGSEWGTEAPWIAHVASTLGADAPSVTVVVNGGEIVYADVERSLDVGRAVLAVDGSGRTADELAAAARGEPAEERAVTLAESGLIRGVLADDPTALALAIGGILDAPPAGHGRALADGRGPG